MCNKALALLGSLLAICVLRIKGVRVAAAGGRALPPLLNARESAAVSQASEAEEITHPALVEWTAALEAREVVVGVPMDELSAGTRSTANKRGERESGEGHELRAAGGGRGGGGEGRGLRTSLVVSPLAMRRVWKAHSDTQPRRMSAACTAATTCAAPEPEGSPAHSVVRKRVIKDRYAEMAMSSSARPAMNSR